MRYCALTIGEVMDTNEEMKIYECCKCHQILTQRMFVWDWQPDLYYCETCGLIEEERLDELDAICPLEYVNTEIYSWRVINELSHKCDACWEIIPNKHRAYVYSDGFPHPKDHSVFHKYCFYGM